MAIKNKPDLYQIVINNLKEMDRKYMEKNKLYLSISEDSSGSYYRLKLHTDTCYIKYIAEEIVEPIDANWYHNDYKKYRMLAINNMASHIYDIVLNNKKDDCYVNDDDLINSAYKIAVEFYDILDASAMWDITEIRYPEKMLDVCEYCDECNDEESEDEEKNYITSMLDRMDDFQDQFYELDHELKNEILKLNNEVFPNNELTARAQIRMTNKRIDDLEHTINNLNARMTWMDWQLKFQTNELPHTGDRNLC